MAVNVRRTLEYSKSDTCTVTSQDWTPLSETGQTEAEYSVNRIRTEAFRQLLPESGAYVNEVWLPSPTPSSNCGAITDEFRHILMNPIFSERFGELIITGWRRLKRLLTQMMCFGVMFVWEMRDGRRLEIICVGFDKSLGGWRGEN